MKTYFQLLFRVAAAFLLILLISSQIFSQSSNPKFGKITKEELSTTAIEQWPDAGAVVLFDIGKTWFEYDVERGFQLKMERHTRIKILKQSALSIADVSIPFYETKTEKDIVSGIKASTFNLVNGAVKESEVGKSGVFEEEVDKYFRLKKFSLPEVREGSIIEYSYLLTSDFWYFLPSWKFQWVVPSMWSEYSTFIPEYFEFTKFKQTNHPFEKDETHSQNRNITITSMEKVSDDIVDQRRSARTGNLQFVEYENHWIQKDVPGFQEEPFITTVSDYLGKIEFQLAGVNFPGQVYKNVVPTWEEMVKILNEDGDFGKFASRNKTVRETARQLTEGLKDDKEKIAALHQYVKTHYGWDEKYHIYASQSLNDFLKNKVGNSAEINLLLVAMLREVGIDANPVILSTRSNGKLNRYYPLIRKFNHVVVCVGLGESSMLMDASDPEFSPEVLPFECLNGEGLLIGEDKYSWVPLVGNFKNIEFHSVKLNVEGEMLHGTMSTSQRGFGAVEMRREMHSKGVESACKTHLKQLLTEGQLLASQFDQPEEKSSTLKGNIEFNTNSYIQMGGELIYIEPLLGFGLTENPLKDPERTYEVDFGFPADDTYQLAMAIPEGYEVAEAPTAKRINFGDGAIKFDFLVEKTEAQVKVSYRYQRRRTVFTPAEYADLRMFFDHVASVTKEPIVLHKKS